jgi:hypothetical protein
MKKIKYICIIILMILFSGCVVYHPHNIDIPLISQKGDLRIDAGVSLMPSVQSTISYGLSDKYAIQGYASIGSDYHRYFQLAAGKYFSENLSTSMEIYGGFGNGTGDAYNDANPGDLYGNYQLYFMQFNFGKSTLEMSKFDIGCGIKTGFLHANLNDANYYFPFHGSNEITRKFNRAVIEPIGFIRFGGNRLKLNVKLSGCYIPHFESYEHRLPYLFFNFGISINYRL